MGILLGLLTALTWGGADFIARFATHRIGALRSMLYMQLTGFFCSPFFFLLSVVGGISRMVPDGSPGLGVSWLGASMPCRDWRSTVRLRLGKWPWWRRSQPVTPR